jgi:hypothetical protein
MKKAEREDSGLMIEDGKTGENQTESYLIVPDRT